MSQTSARLSLPYIQPAQAQKHVTHNEALRLLDILVQLTVVAFDALTPPSTATEGDVYALGANPTDVWAGQGGMLAISFNGTWTFVAARDGWTAGSLTGEWRIFGGGVWSTATSPLQNIEGLGVNTSFDAANKLAVASDATLLNHDGQGHQLKINKAAEADTASLLFQSDFLGRAEMGLAGTDDFAIKVSSDGAAFTTALSFDAVTGLASGAAVQQSAADATAGRLMRADYGYSPGNVLGTVSESGGMPTGAVIERGENINGRFVRFADGTQICSLMSSISVATNQSTGALFQSPIGIWTFPASFASGSSVLILATSDSENRWAVARPLSESSARFRQYSNSYSSGDVNTRLIAFGYWF